MINYTPKLFVVIGSPASGKDELIQAVNSLGQLHACVVPKHTDRKWRPDDGNEMICKQIPDRAGNLIDNPEYNMDSCEIQYNNYGSNYGVCVERIWDGLRDGVHQVLVVSNVDALNKLKQVFGSLAVFLYVYSETTKAQYMDKEREKFRKKNPGANADSSDYLRKREENFDMAWKLYEDNFMLFDHVFIYSNRPEDLYDQIFRLFRYYEKRNS